MGASDGYVVGTTKIVDHGPDNIRWNLVIIGDGYQSNELTKYHNDVQNFLNILRATPPYDGLFCGINVHRIDVVSNESGADDPGCAGGPVITANTYFDASFCTMFAGAPLDRLLAVNDTLALSVATAQVPLRHQVLCIVNSSKYGGSGGAVATCSTNVQAAQIAIHEIGHSAYGLADEYGGDGTGTPAGEPVQPNVTRDTDRATNKWRALIDPATPMPSGCDPDPTGSTCVAPAVAPPAGAVGTYEGGAYTDHNVYRPLPNCKMRALADPFCPVCAGAIRQTLQPFTPVESVTLTTPSIAFSHVPAGMGGVGVTTHRAIVWDVVTCRNLTFQITAGPTGGFGTPFGTSIAVTTDPVLDTTSARLWVSYTSTNPGDSAHGSVTVICNETGQTWPINIVADTIARPRAAVALVLDRSGSMNDDAGDATTKVAKLREATNAFISIMLPDDGIGLVRFNEFADRIMEVVDAGAAPGGAGRTDALAHITNDIAPSGSTSIGDGVVKGKQMLDAAVAAAPGAYGTTAMVVLTDGMWNQPPDLATVSGSITANTYAVGFGLPSNISVPALTTLCQGHDGYLLITGALSTDQSMRLDKYFLQILAGVTNAQVAADPQGVLDSTAEHRIPFWICAADYGMDLIVLSQYPGAIVFQLEAPDGTRITPASGPGGANAQYVLSAYAAYYRCALPVLPANATGSHEGRWYAVLKLGSTPVPVERVAKTGFDPKRGLGYEFVAHTYSTLTFKANVAQSSFEVGAGVRLSATLREYQAALTGRAKVWAEITRPDGVAETLRLDPDAQGQFVANYAAALPGVFAIRLRARGETMHGAPFEREQTLTAVGVPGGDKWSPGDPQTSGCCGWSLCLQGRPYRLNLALGFGFLIWLAGFVWGDIVLTTSLQNAAAPIAYISAIPAISFPLLILWLLLVIVLARIYLKAAADKACEGLKLALTFLLVNLVLDLVVIVILLGAGLGYFAWLAVWLGYLILLVVPWLTGRALQRAEMK